MGKERSKMDFRTASFVYKQIAVLKHELAFAIMET